MTLSCSDSFLCHSWQTSVQDWSTTYSTGSCAIRIWRSLIPILGSFSTCSGKHSCSWLIGCSLWPWFSLPSKSFHHWWMTCVKLCLLIFVHLNEILDFLLSQLTFSTYQLHQIAPQVLFLFSLLFLLLFRLFSLFFWVLAPLSPNPPLNLIFPCD